MVAWANSAVFGLPMMRMSMLNSMVRTRIPHSSVLSRSVRWIVAVTSPATTPASMAATVAATGSTFAAISAAATQPPSGNEPSTVRSGNDSSRNGIMMPRAANA